LEGLDRAKQQNNSAWQDIDRSKKFPHFSFLLFCNVVKYLDFIVVICVAKASDVFNLIF